MKATGIVRRIDDLGRVVVPKEIRRTLRIREGEPLEIFTNREGGIVLKKYSPIGELAAFAKEYVEAVAQVAKCTVCVTETGLWRWQDREKRTMPENPFTVNCWKQLRTDGRFWQRMPNRTLAR